VDNVAVTPEVAQALKALRPVVALESTVITHGLPYPENLTLAREMEAAIAAEGATPATIGVVDGVARAGLTDDMLEALARDGGHKISRRDLAAAVIQKASGGTTVAATLLVAHRAGIRAFATGGIGGVHRDAPSDISADLQCLADTPVIVVCAGAKAILDLPATLEYLETMSVPVAGYQTDEFPAFYSRTSGLTLGLRLDSPAQIAAFAREHWNMGQRSAVLVANPVPDADAISREEIEPVIERAVKEAHERRVQGQAVTPFLLQRINELTEGKSLKANLSLLLNNARLAGRIASAISVRATQKAI
jgi:pseudouridine-5'-phosphate glycosidase